MSPLPVKSKQHDTTRYFTCPNCGGRDLRGPLDKPPTPPRGHFTRAWFCRTCWWDTFIVLRDDTFLAATK